MATSGNAKKLRQHMTDAERKLWNHLRGTGLGGFKFRRQYQLGPYIADFISFEAKLVVEVDGDQHASQSATDNDRSDWLRSNGFRVLRFWNHEVLQQTDAVLRAITEGLTPTPACPQRDRGYEDSERL
jgi:very-short-patch-repair endonuclease